MIKILKGAGIAAVGAILTYISAYVMDTNFVFEVSGQMMDFTPAVVAAWSVLANVARKALGL